MRRRLILSVVALLLLGSCSAVGLSIAVDEDGRGSGTVTATADVGGAAPVPDTAGAADVAGPPARLAGGPEGEQQVRMTLAGGARGLVPGRRGQVLEVVVTNPADNVRDALLALSDVDALVRGPAGSCGPEDLVVTPYDAGAPGAPTYTVRRGESVVVPLAVLLVDRPDRDQTDCTGASFPLTLTATARVVA